MLLSDKERHYFRVKAWNKIFQANSPMKEAGVATLISSDIDFQPKVIKIVKEGHLYTHQRKMQKPCRDQC